MNANQALSLHIDNDQYTNDEALRIADEVGSAGFEFNFERAEAFKAGIEALMFDDDAFQAYPLIIQEFFNRAWSEVDWDALYADYTERVQEMVTE